MSRPIFVFGSNLAGRHGKGAALWAREHRGAIYGQGRGRQGRFPDPAAGSVAETARGRLWAGKRGLGKIL
jgi:hypothetical protein